MLSKKGSYDPTELAPSRRLRANLQDIFATNQLPGTRVQDVINDVADAGVKSFTRLKNQTANAHRNLLRTFLRGTQWPRLYWAKIRVYSLTTHLEEEQWCAFILPHEYMEVLCRLGDHTALLAIIN